MARWTEIIFWWEDLIHRKQLRAYEKLFFGLLCFFEKLYCIGFYLAQTYKKKIHTSYRASIPVISLGNISVGGTGKSVLTQFIVKNLIPQVGVVFLRGYGGQNVKTGHSSFLNNLDDALGNGANLYGDEAQMLASLLKCPIIVGPNRKKSFLLLKNKIKELSASYILLDDGYQNNDLVKDLEILLLDARAPFDNNYCLPAGRLREKNITRADLIILTHADLIDEHNQQAIIKSIRSKGYSNPIFMGRHLSSDLLNVNFDPCLNFNFDRKYLAIAGIGSPDQFLVSLRNKGVKLAHVHFFEDHHNYIVSDVALIKQLMQEYGAQGIITTCKDLVKLAPFFYDCKNLYALDVEFTFLNAGFHRDFLTILKKKIFQNT